MLSKKQLPLLLVDNDSAFTGRIAKILADVYALGSSDHSGSFAVVPFDLIDEQTIKCYGSFILSGRRHNNRKMNVINSRIVRDALHDSKKLLGICYGAEIMTLTLGGTIRRMAQGRRGVMTQVRINRPTPITPQRGDLRVYSSHRYLLGSLGTSLASTASSDGCTNEIVMHCNHKQNQRMFGVQFHPEMSGLDGYSIIERFVRLE